MEEPKALVSDTIAATTTPQPEKSRTPGLRLFDVFLYPIVTNLSVFGISVAATYLTARGGDRNAAGKLIYGRLGEKIQQRGEWMINKFKAMGMSHKQADMSKMVFFSFADGSLMAPAVKLVEDRREDIGCYIDHKLGTKPEDMSVYEKEPKQTWLSVLGGRFVTAAIVVPTAVALDKTGLNDVLFTKPGLHAGAWLAKKTGVTKLFGKLDVKELSRIGFFEAFYTSVCTAGLYFTSRGIASLTGKKKLEACGPGEEKHAVERSEPVAVTHKLPCASSEKPKAKARKDLKRPSMEKPSGGYCDRYAAEAGNRPALATI